MIFSRSVFGKRPVRITIASRLSNDKVAFENVLSVRIGRVGEFRIIKTPWYGRNRSVRL